MHETTLRVSQLAQRQMLADLPGLWHRNPLGAVDAHMAAERIGHKTGDGEIYQVIGAEVWLSGDCAADIDTHYVAERRVRYADIRD